MAKRELQVAEIRESGRVYFIVRQGTQHVCSCYRLRTATGVCAHLAAYHRAVHFGQHVIIPGQHGPIMVLLCNDKGQTGLDPLHHEAYGLALSILGGRATALEIVDATTKICDFVRLHGGAAAAPATRHPGKTRRILVVD
jgi:hypothetical protein